MKANGFASWRRCDGLERTEHVRLAGFDLGGIEERVSVGSLVLDDDEPIGRIFPDQQFDPCRTRPASPSTAPGGSAVARALAREFHVVLPPPRTLAGIRISAGVFRVERTQFIEERVISCGKGGTEGKAMRLYLKLLLVIVIGMLIQSALRPAAQCAWEIRFAARCWLAHQFQDSKLEARLVDEARQRLAADLRAWRAETPVATVPAAAAKPASRPCGPGGVLRAPRVAPAPPHPDRGGTPASPRGSSMCNTL